MKKKDHFGGNKLAQLLGAGRELKAEALLDNNNRKNPAER